MGARDKMEVRHRKFHLSSQMRKEKKRKISLRLENTTDWVIKINMMICFWILLRRNIQKKKMIARFNSEKRSSSRFPKNLISIIKEIHSYLLSLCRVHQSKRQANPKVKRIASNRNWRPKRSNSSTLTIPSCNPKKKKTAKGKKWTVPFRKALKDTSSHPNLCKRAEATITWRKVRRRVERSKATNNGNASWATKPMVKKYKSKSSVSTRINLPFLQTRVKFSKFKLPEEVELVFLQEI